MKYDVFISYRRDGGAATARIIRDRLAELGYRVFFDVESLRSGYFNTALYSVIDQCKDVIVVLSPGALDRCVNADDWVRKEVEHALHQKKNVVPVMLRGFQFPETLPESIDSLRYCNGLEANESFFDAFIEKLRDFLQAKPGFFQSLLQSRLLKRMLPLLLAMLILLGCAGGIKLIIDRTNAAYPRTAAEKNLTQDVIYYVSNHLTRYDLLAESYAQALQAARRYVTSGMTDAGAMEDQFALAEHSLTGADLTDVAPSAEFLRQLADSPFSTADLQAMHDSLLMFRQDCLDSLYYIHEMVDPDYYPTDPAQKLEILDYYDIFLEENLNAISYCANQLLLPVTEESQLEAFWHDTLPYLTNIPLRATNWSEDYDALQSAVDEALNTIEKAITDRAALVGDASQDLAAMEADALQQLVDMGYTRETAEKIWAYQTEDPQERMDSLIQKYLNQGMNQAEAESEAQREQEMLDIQAQLRISSGALVTDDAETLWEKMTLLLRVDLYEEALECAVLYQQQMPNSDNYLPGVQLFIHLMQQTDLDYGVMVMEYYEPDGINEVLQIGDIIYGFDGNPCHNYDEYIAMKEAVTTGSYVVDVLRIDGTTGEWEMLQLTLTTDMPRVYMNDLVANAE